MDTENKTENTGANESRIPAIHTFRSDLDQAVHDQGASLASIMLAEKKRQEEQTKVNEGGGVKNSVVYIILSVLLVTSAVITVYVLKNMTESASTAKVIEDDLTTYISYDKVTHINADGLIGKEMIGNVIQLARSKAGKPGEVEAISLEKGQQAEEISVNEFWNANGSTIPSDVLTALSPKMMLGIYTTKNLDRHVFFVFGVQNYDKALAGVLLWEKTILDDVYAIFNIQINGNYSQIMQASFEDVVINNKNARIIRDINGNPTIYILYINKDLLIITDNEEAIQEITNRSLVRNAKPL